jgi:hypothetical protein
MAEVCGLMNVVPLMAVRLFYFFLDKKVTKNQVSKRLPLGSGPLRCKSVKTWAAIFCPTSFAHPLASAKFAMPCCRTWATIVLADFGRSLVC